MAAEGRLVFPNAAAANTGIGELTRTVKKITLTWRDLRVDPLCANLAVVAAAYHETRISFAGQHVEEDGYFTGLAENRAGRWQFRHAYWSVAVPRSPVP